MREHEVLEDEIFLGRGLALVHFLRPLLQRQLDAEGLVDREGDVEEGERIDAEIVDGVALRRDLLARDVGGLGNDAGDGLEGGGHDVALLNILAIVGATLPGFLQKSPAPPVARRQGWSS